MRLESNRKVGNLFRRLGEKPRLGLQAPTAVLLKDLSEKLLYFLEIRLLQA